MLTRLKAPVESSDPTKVLSHFSFTITLVFMTQKLSVEVRRGVDMLISRFLE